MTQNLKLPFKICQFSGILLKINYAILMKKIMYKKALSGKL